MCYKCIIITLLIASCAESIGAAKISVGWYGLIKTPLVDDMVYIAQFSFFVLQLVMLKYIPVWFDVATLFIISKGSWSAKSYTVYIKGPTYRP